MNLKKRFLEETENEVYVEFVGDESRYTEAYVEWIEQQLILHGVVKSLPSKDTEFIYSLLPEWTKEAPKGLDPTMYGTLTYEGDKEIVDKLKEILK